MAAQTRKQKQMQQRLWEEMPQLVERLIELAQDGEAKPTTIVAAIKELKAIAEELREALPRRVELVVKVVDDGAE